MASTVVKVEEVISEGVRLTVPVAAPAVGVAEVKAVPPQPGALDSGSKEVESGDLGDETSSPKTSQKSKKSKSKAVSVTMATATASSASTGAQGENTGRWTAEEHRLFLQGLDQHGKGWKKIASLIKSRTVVQIRTHAQKYFQKLAKARQNGEDGDVPMDGRTTASISSGVAATAATAPSSAAAAGIASAPSASKRRRQPAGTKRKALTSVVASVQRDAKKLAVAAPGTTTPPPALPAVSPALAPFVVTPSPSTHILPQATPPLPAPVAVSAPAPVSVPAPPVVPPPPSASALEDTLFRFLTPATGDSGFMASQPPLSDPLLPPPAPQPAQHHVNDVARQAGANPITLPSADPPVVPADMGEVSPTGVADLGGAFPSWADVTFKETPDWYTKGADVDELLNEADALDWLTDTGDLNETYAPPAAPAPVAAASQPVPDNVCSVGNQTPSMLPSASFCAAAEASTGDDVDVAAIIAAPSSSNLASVALPPVAADPCSSQTTHATASDSATNVAALPSLYDGGGTAAHEPVQATPSEPVPSAPTVYASATEASDAPAAAEVSQKNVGMPEANVSMDESFAVFEANFDEQEFVSALLENNGESSHSLPALA